MKNLIRLMALKVEVKSLSEPSFVAGPAVVQWDAEEPISVIYSLLRRGGAACITAEPEILAVDKERPSTLLAESALLLREGAEGLWYLSMP